jgi:AraC-like DNA-binding protein
LPFDKSIEMNYLESLNTWFSKFKKYIVTYKDGFFQLANVANSPYAIIESFDKMPFCTHNRTKRQILSNTMFINANLLYLDISPTLWIFVSDLKLKKNVAIQNIYEPNLPKNFHIFNLQFYERTISGKQNRINGAIVSDRTWTLFKAGVANQVHHFKDTRQFNITVYFTDEWLKQQQASKLFLNNETFTHFFNSENDYIFWPDHTQISQDVYAQFLLRITTRNEDLKVGMEQMIIELFEKFIRTMTDELKGMKPEQISFKDIKYIQKVEKKLLENLQGEFPGIEELAKHAGVSTTKLKNDFKAFHRTSLFQYFRSHKLKLAHTIIAEKNTPIKEVAKFFGYENASKFSEAFKDEFGYLPSTLVKGNE